MSDEKGRELRALHFAWGHIPLAEGNMEANFSRLMAPVYGVHHYDATEMERVVASLMIGFLIDIEADVGQMIEVASDNLRMNLFLLWLAFEEVDLIQPGQSIRFRVTEAHHKKAERFFGAELSRSARSPVDTKHPNLKRFFARGAVVTVYLAE